MEAKGEPNLAGLVNEKLIHKSFEFGRDYEEVFVRFRHEMLDG